MIETDCIQLSIYGTLFLTYLEPASATEIAPLQQEDWVWFVKSTAEGGG